MLARLAVRQKLSLLLLFPLITAVLAIVPFTVERVDSARAGAAAARIARLAQATGALVGDLQRERLLSLAYLVSAGVERVTVVAQERAVDDDVDTMSVGLDNPVARQAVEKVKALRGQVLQRAAAPGTTYAGYHAAVAALLDALGLPDQPALDAGGLHQMDVLDAALRSNEEANQVLAALVVTTGAPADGAVLLASAQIRLDQAQDRFRSLATTDQAALLDRVLAGPTGQRVAALAAQLSATGQLSTSDSSTSKGATSTKDSIAAAASLTLRPADLLAVVLTASQLRAGVVAQLAAGAIGQAEHQARAGAVAAGSVAATAAALLALILILSIRVTRSIASPLRRLAHAASAVADIAGAELVRVGDSDEALHSPPKLAAVNVRGEDEIGQLGAAINRVQAIAALMLERQISTQANIAVIFANIAYRTQTLVSRQISLIDEMEREEPDARVLSKLYRLDHVTARLRRSADSLLVVSGTRDTTMAAPARMVDVIRAAAAEIEGFQAVRLGRTIDVVVAAELADDLRLLLAELLENATTFSPPGAQVDVHIQAREAGCGVTIVDHGIGISTTRLAEENQRIVVRPRLDVAPTELLGLFVVGRLARRHGLTVRLEPTPRGGVTAVVEIPARLLMAVGPDDRIGRAGPEDRVADFPVLERSFTWFGGLADLAGPATRQHLAIATAAGPPPSPVAIPEGSTLNGTSRNGLHRRIPGARLAGAGTASAPTRPARHRDAADEATQWAAYAQGTQRAQADQQAAYQQIAGHPPPELPAHPSGLVRRIPGALLDESVRQPIARTRNRRDPDADRASLDSFVEGLARARHRPRHP